MDAQGEFALCGRAKDTIVLSGGRTSSRFPSRRSFAKVSSSNKPLCLPGPEVFWASWILLNRKRIEEYLTEKQIPLLGRQAFATMQEVKNLIEHSIGEIISSKQGFKSFDTLCASNCSPRVLK